MGDSRLFLNIILKENPSLQIKDSFCLSADSTLCDVISYIQSVIGSSNDNNVIKNNTNNRCCSFYQQSNEDGDENENRKKACFDYSYHPLVLYDCTSYPPKEITDKVHQFTGTIGPKSITLQSLGWFPSAKLYICQVDDEDTKSSIMNSNMHLNEEFEYNNPTLNSNVARFVNKKVQLTGELGEVTTYSSQQPLPSQLFKAIETRFDNNNDDNDDSNNHKLRTSKRHRTEEERRKYLDMRLDQLEKSTNKKGKKKSKMSDQVRKMLIKSRAEGNKNIRQEDRFYLEVVVLDESNKELCNESDVNVEKFMKSTHMFFSRVATIGKVVSAGSGSLASARDKGAELLVLTETSVIDEKVYRRLPTTLPIHEAAMKGYIEDFGRVIVRIFKGEIDSVAKGYTKSINS